MFEWYPEFYRGKRVFVTGHTGFKGAWLCRILKNAGAEVTGYSLQPPTDPSLFAMCEGDSGIHSVIGDIRDFETLFSAFQESKPEIVLHLAAQPIVREGYRDPLLTYGTNVMGTVNLLECARRIKGVRSFVNVTTDKVYENREWPYGYRENDPLDGYDPYSNSKSCSELVTHSYRNSFFSGTETAVSTVRAGNVIGGGDFAADRIIPDCVRAALGNGEIVLRHPDSTRPYQHVLEPLFVYLMIAARQAEDPHLAGYYNVGPDDNGCYTTGALATLFARKYGSGLRVTVQPDGGPHEANFLRLDCSLLKSVFGWRPVYDLEQAVEKTAEWTKVYAAGGDIGRIMDTQIAEFLAAAQKDLSKD